MRQVPSLTVRNCSYPYLFLQFMASKKLSGKYVESQLYSADTATTLGGPGVPSVTVVPKTTCRFGSLPFNTLLPGNGLHKAWIGEEFAGGFGAIGIEPTNHNDNVPCLRIPDPGDQGEIL